MGLGVFGLPPSRGRRLVWMKRAGCALLLTAACATPPTASAPPATLAQARQSYTAEVSSCQRIRNSRLTTLGPPIFQPISGDEPFNDCVTRAKADLNVATLLLQ
jgi:hypothetical protein